MSGNEFLPSKMCVCLEGWSGVGNNCTQCDEQSYSNRTDAASCIPCPNHSKTHRRGATSPTECACSDGRILVHHGTACGCGTFRALGNEGCVSCAELNLNCSEEDSEVQTAPPLNGFARLDPRLKEGRRIKLFHLFYVLENGTYYHMKIPDIALCTSGKPGQFQLQMFRAK